MSTSGTDATWPMPAFSRPCITAYCKPALLALHHNTTAGQARRYWHVVSLQEAHKTLSAFTWLAGRHCGLPLHDLVAQLREAHVRYYSLLQPVRVEGVEEEAVEQDQGEQGQGQGPGRRRALRVSDAHAEVLSDARVVLSAALDAGEVPSIHGEGQGRCPPYTVRGRGRGEGLGRRVGTGGGGS